MDNAFFSQFIDHAGDLRQTFTRLLLILNNPQVTDRISRGLAIVAIAIPTLIGLPYIFFGCLMICHELDIFRTAKVSLIAGITKFDRFKIIKMP